MKTLLNKWTMTVYKVVMVPPRAFHAGQNANIMDPSTHGLYQGPPGTRSRTLNKGTEHELASRRSVTQREKERDRGSLRAVRPPLRSCSSVLTPIAAGYGEEDMFPAMRHSVKLINKKTPNVSSAPKIATAKCVHWSSVRVGGWT